MWQLRGTLALDLEFFLFFGWQPSESLAMFSFLRSILAEYFELWVIFLGGVDLSLFFASGDLERRKRYTSAYWALLIMFDCFAPIF